MNKIQSIILIAGMLIPAFSKAQNEVDALRYSYTDYGGTARFMSGAGSFGAIGADISVISINPSGLGRFNRNEIMFSPGFNIYSTSSEYNHNHRNSSDFRGNWSNIGMVATTKPEGYNNWKSVQFTVAYNKRAIFNQSTTISGENTNSILAVFAAGAYGINTADLENSQPFTGSLAYETYAINPYINSVGDVAYSISYPLEPVNQTKTITRKGGIGETSFALSGNYNDKIYIGGALSMPSIRFEENSSHFEELITPGTGNDSLKNLTYGSFLNTRGSGLNGKIGITYAPVNWFRIAAAYHTKTRYRMTDSWTNSMDTRFNEGTIFSQSPQNAGKYNYLLFTPSRYVLSAAAVIMKRGFINVDFEQINYGSAELRSDVRFDNYSFANENGQISKLYKNASNIRIGGEFRITKPLSVRAGYAFYGNPIKDEFTEQNTSKFIYSAGIGFRRKSYYLDLAYSLTEFTEDYYLYDPVLVNATILDQRRHDVIATIGFKF